MLGSRPLWKTRTKRISTAPSTSVTWPTPWVPSQPLKCSMAKTPAIGPIRVPLPPTSTHMITSAARPRLNISGCASGIEMA